MDRDSPHDGDITTDGFWASECGAGAKRLLIAVLVTCFVAQTGLVYLDPSATSPLSLTAREGRRIWHRHNCQSCHQLHGFGGFLGPDLTNASTHLSPQRLERLLTEGSGGMPGFDLSADEVAAVGEFLVAMNETGQGQARLGRDDGGTRAPAGRLLVPVIRNTIAKADDAQTATAFDLFAVKGCLTCHFPPDGSPTVASDLFTVTDRLDREEIMTVLENGRPPDMPPPFLSPEELETMYGFLGWLGRERYPLLERSRPPVTDEGFWSEVPWWEFAR